MILLVASLLVLWWALSRSTVWKRIDAQTTARLFKLGAGVFVLLAAIVVFLRGHIEVALLLLGGGLWLFNLANKAGPRRAPASAGATRQRSAMIELEVDRATGAMRGLVLAGPNEGRRLDQMTRAQCETLYAFCRQADGGRARLLETYFDRRFAGWRQAGQGNRDAGPGRARRTSAMSEEEAYEVLGLPRGAQRDDIVRSHRSLMKKLHPDQGGSTDLAARVNEAKEVLMRRHT